MVSKINTLLLGLIAQKPLNPYELEKILGKSKIRDWFPISKSSVYAGIRALQGSELIEGEVRKDSNMPEKTIYHLTAKGSSELKEAVAQCLASLDLDPVQFSIGSFFMCLLDKTLVINILNEKIKAMDQETFALKKQLDEISLSYIEQSIIKHRIYLMFSEAKTIREMLEKIEQDTLWNYQFAEDLYE
jgi:DNA-binding PadR family transcriptional regulator